jgi:hypothetical protein
MLRRFMGRSGLGGKGVFLVWGDVVGMEESWRWNGMAWHGIISVWCLVFIFAGMAVHV